MAVKYVVDAALIYWTTGLVWTPVDYLLSLANISNSKAASFTLGLSMTLIIWTIPFVWLGVLLSVRRAKDAERPPWIVVAFFIPVVNYLLMALLAAWPPIRFVSTPVPEQHLTELEQRAAARNGLIAGVSAGLVASIGSVVLGALFIKTYGGVMFLLTPFVVGLVSAYASRRVNPWAPLPLKGRVHPWSHGRRVPGLRRRRHRLSADGAAPCPAARGSRRCRRALHGATPPGSTPEGVRAAR